MMNRWRKAHIDQQNAKSELEILFNDCKMYWRPRVTLDIVIAHHILKRCLEIIVYRAELKAEAPRIYLSTPKVVRLLDKHEVEWKLKALEKARADAVDSFGDADRNKGPILETVLNEAISLFILDRLAVKTNTDGRLAMTFMPRRGEDVLYDDFGAATSLSKKCCPPGIVPLKAIFLSAASTSPAVSIALRVFLESLHECQLRLKSPDLARKRWLIAKRKVVFREALKRTLAVLHPLFPGSWETSTAKYKVDGSVASSTESFGSQENCDLEGAPRRRTSVCRRGSALPALQHSKSSIIDTAAAMRRSRVNTLPTSPGEDRSSVRSLDRIPQSNASSPSKVVQLPSLAESFASKASLNPSPLCKPGYSLQDAITRAIHCEL
eukprot:gene1360-1483_t